MKRLTAIILTVMILLSSFTPVSATENPTTENKKIKWLLENNFIVGRGQTKDLKLEETITRAEFTRIVLASKGEENLAREASNLKSDFKDVPDSHWAEKFIAYAKEKGYISGYPDGNFIPEGKITYEEIISILARIHPQYKKIEANSTNWAEGFIKFAKDNGILDDINIVGSYKSPAIREKTFEMAYNFIKIADKTTKSEENSKTKETKEVKETKKENSIGNGFYPYWIDYGFRTSSEEKPEVKPNPDVKPTPDKPEKPEKENPGSENPTEPGTEPEAPKEFDKTNITKIKVKTQPAKLVYTESDKLDLTGLELTLTDNQGLTKGVAFADFGTYNITTTPANEATLTTNENGTTIKIKLNEEVKAETNALTVKEKVFDPENVKSIAIKTQPTKLVYTDGEKLDLTGLEVKLTDDQNLTKGVAFADFGTYNITTTPANEATLTTNENGTTIKIKLNEEVKAETNVLTVKEKVFDPENVESITVKTQPTKLEYTDGEKLDLAGLAVILKDKQGLTKEVAFADFDSNGITTDPTNDTDLTVANNGKPVTITKGSLTATTNALTVNPKVFDKNNITKIEVIAPPAKLNYVVDELLNIDGLKVRLTDNQRVTKEIGAAEFNAYGITTDPIKETKLTISENGKSIVISRGNTEVITGNISLKLKVISKADFKKENKIKKSIKNSLVEVYKNLGDLKLGIDNLQNKYYLLFTKDANETTYDKKNLKTSIIATIKNNNIKSYTIGETKRDLTKSDDEILGFLREDILKLAELEGNPNATDVQILEKLKTTKPRIKIKLEFGDENISLDYEIIFLTQMAEEKLNQIEADFAKNMKDTSKIVDNENKGYRVSYNNKYYLVEHKNAIRDYSIVPLARDHRYDIVLTNFLTGEKLGESKSLKELKSFMVHTIRNSLDIDNRGIMDSMELQTLLGGGNYREITESYHETFRGSNNNGSIVAENLENSNISLEYFYADEVCGTGGIITRVIRYEHY